MAKKRYSVAVEISPARLKIVTLDSANDKLLSAVVKDLSSLEGEKEKRRYIIDALKEALQPDILRRAVTILCLSDEAIQFKRIELPRMPIKEIAEALKWRIKGIVSFDVESAVLDFDVIDEITGEDGAKNFSVLMAAIQRGVIDNKVSMLKESGVETIGSVNVDSFGLANIIKLTPEGKKDTDCAVLKVTYTKSTVNIYKDGRLVFVRNIPIGLDNIKDSIRGPVTTDKGSVELGPEDIKDLKNIGIPDNKDILLMGKLQGRHILALVRPILENLCNEINRSFDYYNVQLEGKEISKLYLVGVSFKYKGLDRFIRDTLGIGTEYLELPPSLFDIKTENVSEIKEVMPQVISLIGAARGGVGAKINLLPIDYRVEKAQKIQKISIRMVGFVALAILLASFILINVRVNDYNRRLTNAKRHIKILHEIRIIYNKISQRERFVNAVRTQETPSIYILKELSNIIPENIVLGNLLINQKEGIIKFSGTVYMGTEVGEVVLTKFMESMEKSHFFKNINLESSQKEVIGDEEVAIFSISCSIQR